MERRTLAFRRARLTLFAPWLMKFGENLAAGLSQDGRLPQTPKA
jgi:hypothetical protein